MQETHAKWSFIHYLIENLEFHMLDVRFSIVLSWHFPLHLSNLNFVTYIHGQLYKLNHILHLLFNPGNRNKPPLEGASVITLCYFLSVHSYSHQKEYLHIIDYSLLNFKSAHNQSIINYKQSLAASLVK